MALDKVTTGVIADDAVTDAKLGITRLSTSETAPVSPTVGQRWYKATTGVTYQYTANADDTKFWLDVSSGGIGTSASKSVDFVGDVDPHKATNGSGLAVGNVYYNRVKNKHFILELDIRNLNSFFLSDCMISDWSGVAIEYAFALEKPVLYVDIPKKINNHDYNDLEIIPLEEKIRSQIGAIISPLELSNLYIPTIPHIRKTFVN